MSGANGQRKVKGGSMGLAAAIQQQKSQGGGLQELRKSLSSKDSRAAKSQSVYVGSYPSGKESSQTSGNWLLKYNAWGKNLAC